MKAFGLFLIVPLSIVVYVVLATGFGIYQRYPVAHYVVAGLALVFLFRLIRSKFSWWRLVMNLAGWALLGFFVWWTLSYSEYPEIGGEVAQGENVTGLSEVSLSGEDGKLTELAPLLAGQPAVLLVFYRGFW